VVLTRISFLDDRALVVWRWCCFVFVFKPGRFKTIPSDFSAIAASYPVEVTGG